MDQVIRNLRAKYYIPLISISLVMLPGLRKKSAVQKTGGEHRALRIALKALNQLKWYLFSRRYRLIESSLFQTGFVPVVRTYHVTGRQIKNYGK